MFAAKILATLTLYRMFVILTAFDTEKIYYAKWPIIIII